MNWESWAVLIEEKIGVYEGISSGARLHWVRRENGTLLRYAFMDCARKFERAERQAAWSVAVIKGEGIVWYGGGRLLTGEK